MPTDSQQTSEHTRDVSPQDASVRVDLVDNDVPELREETRPFGVVRQDGRMQHIRIGEYQVALGTNLSPPRSRSITIEYPWPNSIAQIAPVNQTLQPP